MSKNRRGDTVETKRHRRIILQQFLQHLRVRKWYMWHTTKALLLHLDLIYDWLLIITEILVLCALSMSSWQQANLTSVLAGCGSRVMIGKNEQCWGNFQTKTGERISGCPREHLSNCESWWSTQWVPTRWRCAPLSLWKFKWLLPCTTSVPAENTGRCRISVASPSCKKFWMSFSTNPNPGFNKIQLLILLTLMKKIKRN